MWQIKKYSKSKYLSIKVPRGVYKLLHLMLIHSFLSRTKNLLSVCIQVALTHPLTPSVNWQDLCVDVHPSYAQPR